VQPDRIRSIAVLGGGTAGWIAASVLARALAGTDTSVTVIESPEIGRIGVGEATIPAILDLLRFLQIDEADFVHHVGATYKLGIKFFDWRRLGHTYWHPFGAFGTPIARRPFYHAWLKACADGLEPRFNDFSLCAAMGDELKFRPPDARTPGPAAGIRYALHFDAHRVARYLRAYAERQGVTRLERTVSGATRRDDGFIDEIVFDDGSRLGADLYLDCSGFRGVLIEQTLQTGYIPWGQWLPCDRAVAVESAMASPRTPYTGAFARPAGWRWRIPLQERAGNGYVYSSQGISDEAAFEDLRSELGETLLSPPRFLRFVTGRRKQLWNRNCVALGLASGFIEPLESTNIQLAISGVYNLLDHFPDRNFDPANIAAYNAELIGEVEHVRDFIILHYCLTERDDTAVWRGVRETTLPDSLQAKIDLYRGSGRIGTKPRDLFTDLSWFYIFDGMGVRPAAYDPLMDAAPRGRLAHVLGELARDHATALAASRSHDSYFPQPLGHNAPPVPVGR
jgi:tryptophan halogenase